VRLRERAAEAGAAGGAGTGRDFTGANGTSSACARERLGGRIRWLSIRN